MSFHGPAAVPRPSPVPAPHVAGPGPPRRILCAIDFSPSSLKVVEQAVLLARACGGEVTVLFVVPYAAPSRADRARLPPGIDDAVSDDLGSPVAALGRRIVMPGWALELLDRDQLAAMLAHEVAHLARRDPLWKLMVALGGALLWLCLATMLARAPIAAFSKVASERHLGTTLDIHRITVFAHPLARTELEVTPGSAEQHEWLIWRQHLMFLPAFYFMSLAGVAIAVAMFHRDRRQTP